MMRTLFGIGLALLLVLAVVGGVDDDTAVQLAAERTAAIERERTERTYITAHQLMWLATERESTLRLVVVLLIVVVASTAAVIVAVQVLRRPAQSGPPPVLRRVAQLPGHRLDYDEVEGWIVVLPGEKEYYTIEDARRLLKSAAIEE